MLSVVKLFPVPKTSVLVVVAYHSIVAPRTEVDAEIVTTPDPHLDAPVPVGVVGIGLMVTRTAFLLADTQVVLNLDST